MLFRMIFKVHFFSDFDTPPPRLADYPELLLTRRELEEVLSSSAQAYRGTRGLSADKS